MLAIILDTSTAVIVNKHQRSLIQITIANIIKWRSLTYSKNSWNVTQKHEVIKCCWKKCLLMEFKKGRVVTNLRICKNSAASTKHNDMKHTHTKKTKFISALTMLWSLTVNDLQVIAVQMHLWITCTYHRQSWGYSHCIYFSVRIFIFIWSYDLPVLNSYHCR